MLKDSNEPPVLFANTGIQIVCFPLKSDGHLTAEKVGSGWQHCRCAVQDKVVSLCFVQWQVLNRKFYLAIDTSIAPEGEEIGYFSKASSLSGDFLLNLHGILGLNGAPLADLPPMEVIIRPAKAEGGEPRDVHMVIDFGNSRTGVLLLEYRGDTASEPLMAPLQLIDRYRLDAWDKNGNWSPASGTWWFSSRTQWCTTPYLPAQKVETIVDREVTKQGTFGGKKKENVRVSVFVTPHTFEELSLVRMGSEADALAGITCDAGEIRSGVSSPKRYLWAKDASWLDGANWYMADPFDRYESQQHSTTLKGPLLKFIPEDDLADSPAPNFDEAPTMPRHAPRVLMIGALYEMICQAFTYMNSPSYRELTGDSGRMRVLRSLTLTFPAGMISVEREQLEKQARKAVSIFMQTAGRAQETQPEVKLSLDEASAVHLTYIWSEARKLGRKPSLWFSVMGTQSEAPAAPAEEAPAPAQPAAESAPQPASGGGGGGAVKRVARFRKATRVARPSKAEPVAPNPEVRIACIDIGGGTSDLMIAKYICENGIGGDEILGETLHRDGISMAGDHLIKRLLETVIIPQFVHDTQLEEGDAQRLFGPESPMNRKFRAQRIHWINRLFVPLAQAYLENAVLEVEDQISHTDPLIVAPEVVQSLQSTINSLWHAGRYNVKEKLNLYYDREEFEAVVDEVFGDLLFDFCESIVEHGADVVLLAGQPTKLPYIRHLVETRLPLPKSRIIPMFGRYAGAWYPYQNPDNLNPGVIFDPKSTVVVGAAIEISARRGMLSQFRFRMADKTISKSYCWGVMTESRIDKDKIIFHQLPEDALGDGVQSKEFKVTSQSLIIGRKRREREDAQASPVYQLKVMRGPQLEEIDFMVRMERRRTEGEEELFVESVEGVVDGEPAILGKNVFFEWRTLADERYYLDTGGLDKLEL